MRTSNLEPLERVTTFHDSAHAENRRIERGISMQAMKDVINYPDRRKQQYPGEHGGMVYRCCKRDGTKELVVIAEIKKSEAWLISGFYNSI